MAIAVDSTSSGRSGTPVTSYSVSHTCSGSDRILFSGVAVNGTNTVTGVTYNGVAMTQTGSNVSSGTKYLYHLVAPSTGANNVTVSTSSIYVAICSGSYTGAAQTGQPDANADGSNSLTTSMTGSVTTVADNSWTVMYAGLQRPVSASTGSTLRVSEASWGTGLFDSNGAITPAGSTSMSVTFSSAGAGSMGYAIASFSPAVAASTFTPKVMFF